MSTPEQMPVHVSRIVTYILERARPRSIVLCSSLVLVLWELCVRLLDDGAREYIVYRFSVVVAFTIISTMARGLSLEFSWLFADVAMLFPSGARSFARWKQRAIYDTLTFRSTMTIALLMLTLTIGIATFFGGQDPPPGFSGYPLYLIHLIPLLLLSMLLVFCANLIVGSLMSLSNLVAIHEEMM